MAIAHKFAGQKVAEILQQKRGRIKQAPLFGGSPSWIGWVVTQPMALAGRKTTVEETNHRLHKPCRD